MDSTAAERMRHYRARMTPERRAEVRERDRRRKRAAREAARLRERERQAEPCLILADRRPWGGWPFPWRRIWWLDGAGDVVRRWARTGRRSEGWGYTARPLAEVVSVHVRRGRWAVTLADRAKGRRTRAHGFEWAGGP